MPSVMTPQKRKLLVSKGWKVGGPKELLGLTKKQVASIERELKPLGKGKTTEARPKRNSAKTPDSLARRAGRSAVQSKSGHSGSTRPARGHPMEQTYKAAITQSGKWWIGWIQEVPGVNCQEKSRSALLESLRVTLQEALKFNRAEALRVAGT